MKKLLLLFLLISPTAFGFNVANYPFEEFRKTLCHETSCLDMGPDHVLIAGDDYGIKITRTDFEWTRAEFLRKGLNFDEDTVFSDENFLYAELAISEIAVGACEFGKGVCAMGAFAGYLNKKLRLASVACVAAMPKCQKHYQDNIDRVNRLLKEIDERRRSEKEEKEAESGAPGGGPNPPDGPGTPVESPQGRPDLECRLMPAYTIVIDGVGERLPL